MNMFSRRNIIIGAIGLVALLIIWSSFFGGKKESPYEFAAAARGTIVQEVSVTGRVKSASSVELAFERGGRIAAVGAKAGDRVAQGDVLAELDRTELAAQVSEALAALAVQQAKLSEMRKGTRAEELELARVKAANAAQALSDAQASLSQTKQKATTDLQVDYDGGLTAGLKSANIAVNSLFILTDIQNAHFSGFDQDAIKVADAKANAVLALLGSPGAGRATKDALGQMTGGAKGAVLTAQASPTQANVDAALAKLKTALETLKAALDAVPVLPRFTTTDATNLNTERNNTATELITTSANIQAIEAQKASNASSVLAAEAKVNDAASALAAANAELSLKEAGSTPEQLAAQEANVKQAAASFENAQAQLAKASLRAPFAGVVTRQDAKVGEIVAANTQVTAMISDVAFEIEANVPEADIAKIALGNAASVTLDAYGGDEFFDAVVSAIDPAETIIEGVPTYKVTLQFTKKDDRIRSGMTANTDILAARKEGVIVIPQRALVSSGAERTVRVLADDGSVNEVKVETGLRGSDGNIEILSGVSEGENVVTFVKE